MALAVSRRTRSIRIGATSFWLWGIDAPEAKAGSAPDGWQAGTAACRALQSFIEECRIGFEPRDRYGRTVALCRGDGRDLGAEMDRIGMAGLGAG